MKTTRQKILEQQSLNRKIWAKDNGRMHRIDANKLIAEFMGDEWHKDFFKDVCIISPSNISYKFHNDWNWLMTVVIKCFEIFGNTDTIDYTKLNDALLTCNIDELHRVVVELIKQYNEKNTKR